MILISIPYKASRCLIKDFPLDIFCIDETKLDDRFADYQFKIDGYQFPPPRRNMHNFGGGKIVYIKDCPIVKRINDFETNISETISIELTISSKKWLIMFAYRPQNESNKLISFNEVSNTRNKAVNKYDNILATGDLNISLILKWIQITSYVTSLIRFP